MALSFGWLAGDVRESYWIDDPDIQNVSAGDRQAWEDDGDGSHLARYVRPGGKPSRITFRPLTPDEVRIVQGIYLAAADNAMEGMLRAELLSFRIGVDFPDSAETIRDAAGADHQRLVKERGLRMLAPSFVAALERSWPGLVAFYGRKVFAASFPTEPEKKVSSQPSTETPSTSGTASQGEAASGAP